MAALLLLAAAISCGTGAAQAGSPLGIPPIKPIVVVPEPVEFPPPGSGCTIAPGQARARSADELMVRSRAWLLPMRGRVRTTRRAERAAQKR
jgi:hypothetical protein